MQNMIVFIGYGPHPFQFSNMILKQTVGYCNNTKDWFQYVKQFVYAITYVSPRNRNIQGNHMHEQLFHFKLLQNICKILILKYFCSSGITSSNSLHDDLIRKKHSKKSWKKQIYLTLKKSENWSEISMISRGDRGPLRVICIFQHSFGSDYY